MKVVGVLLKIKFLSFDITKAPDFLASLTVSSVEPSSQTITELTYFDTSLTKLKIFFSSLNAGMHAIVYNSLNFFLFS